MKRAVTALMIGLACLALAGPAAWGRIALWAGVPGTSVLLETPAEKGLALYREGDFAAADAAFADAGRSQTFNRALTLAATGKHALSVAYFDAVLFVAPADAEARRLRDLVGAMVPRTRGDSDAPGRLTGHGGRSGDGDTSPWGWPGTPDAAWQRKITARGVGASEAWLETISDDPGEFLRLRLEKEYERRTALGLVRAQEAEPW